MNRHRKPSSRDGIKVELQHTEASDAQQRLACAFRLIMARAEEEATLANGDRKGEPSDEQSSRKEAER
ncbi:unnamed protein product [marine sediment metagenome]|uniref:Uncharacterized protein n=1 Tax=marine sediment metagenome TaxID=412755 RepID=X1IN31_9ZZZZ